MDRSGVAGRSMDALDGAECRRLLATASMGRIAFTEGAMPAIQPASFAVSGGDVLIPTGPGTHLELSEATRDAAAHHRAKMAHSHFYHSV